MKITYLTYVSREKPHDPPNENPKSLEKRLRNRTMGGITKGELKNMSKHKA